MDARQYSSLRDALSDIPDPRKARGQRHAWPLILTLVGVALVSGQTQLRGMGQWVREHAAELCALLQPPRDRLPSAATLRRALLAVDIQALEERLARFAAGLAAASPPAAAATGYAIDGKVVRGANAHGARVHLVSLVRHGDGLVLGQVRVAAKGNEITAAPALLAGRALAGAVVTMDALLTQRALARQILGQGGHYLMMVKENHPTMHEAIARLFASPPPPEPGDHLASCTTVERGHGRLETRTLDRSAALNDYLDWPGVGQVLRRTYHAVDLATGKVSHEVTYGVTSLPAPATAVADVAAHWRAHWTIENRVHRVRDVTLGEDAGQQRSGHLPQALAALRNALIGLLRLGGWANIADALRHYGAYAHRALTFLTAPPPL